MQRVPKSQEHTVSTWHSYVHVEAILQYRDSAKVFISAQHMAMSPSMTITLKEHLVNTFLDSVTQYTHLE
jgi:hypothetical protein